jgi:uncharacterized OB-fold protein
MKLVGWACRECGAVYTSRLDRDECEERHAKEEAAIEGEVFNDAVAS